MQLENGQVWKLDTQEEFDAFVNLKNKQGVKWSYKEWTFSELKERDNWNLSLMSAMEFKGLAVFSTDVQANHYGKDLLKGNNMIKVGDRVKILGGSGEAEYTKGMVGVVTDDVSSRSGYGSRRFMVKLADGPKWGYYKEELKFVEKTKWQEVEREENIGSENGTLIVEQNIETKELRITRGCFTGTLDEFEARVKLKPEGDKHRVVYEWLIEKYKRVYPDYKKVVYVVKLNDTVYYADNGVTINKEEACRWEVKEIAEKIKADYGGMVEEVEL